MEKDIFEKSFIENLNKNFDECVKYFDFEYKHFFDFRTVIFQVTKCLILELDFATITLTNHILERLLKQALISKVVGIKPIPTELWNSIFEGPTKLYSSISLGNSIEFCKKEGLITDLEKDTLFNVIRELMRNGFSHADSTKVLANIPDAMPMFQGNLNDPTNLQPITLNPKIVPPLQSLHMEQFAKANAKNYFSYVFKLLENIELRLLKFSEN
jgi:hypothetical protein